MQQKKRFSAFALSEALALLGTNQVREWQFDITPRAPSEYYQQTSARLAAHFDLSLSEAAKTLLIDAILLEAIEPFARLKIWKEAPLRLAWLSGTVDYLIAPQGKVYQTPLLCVVEAKKDDFEQGMAQCLVEMYACHEYNRQLPAMETYGIVTNAVTWRFYKLDQDLGIHESRVYAETQLPHILGALHFIFACCQSNFEKNQKSK